MKLEEFNNVVNIRQRIELLTLLKHYFEHFLNGIPFKVELKTSILGDEALRIIPFIEGKHTTMLHQQFKEDADYIIEKVQNRIDELQMEFDSL